MADETRVPGWPDPLAGTRGPGERGRHPAQWRRRPPDRGAAGCLLFGLAVDVGLFAAFAVVLLGIRACEGRTVSPDGAVVSWLLEGGMALLAIAALLLLVAASAAHAAASKRAARRGPGAGPPPPRT
jgi:hypothetical protein